MAVALALTPADVTGGTMSAYARCLVGMSKDKRVGSVKLSRGIVRQLL